MVCHGHAEGAEGVPGRLKVLSSLLEVEQIPSSAELGVTMGKTQPEAAPQEVWVGHRRNFFMGKGCQALQLPREVGESLLRWHSVLWV